VARKYALIGDPVAHSLSPALHNAAFEHLGIDAEYKAVRVTRADLASKMPRLLGEFAGFNVTTPLKEAVLSFLDRLTGVAATTAAANTVRVDGSRATGHNTDGEGCVRAVRELWPELPWDAGVLLLGSGPAARAVARAMRERGAASIACWSRNAQTAAAIAPPPSRTADLAISCLPADAVVPDEVLRWIGARTRILDVNYRAAQSPIPAGMGGERSDGLPMLLHQAALAFAWWTGAAEPLEVMRRALQHAVAAD
jgi:shikimate dehydrogenase